ncbi:hypothetical protein ACIA5D_18435 [Actinoplanes sp. NPDC051513]|uniref:hypothetical protein n=1 Tax=Actinoplanes sp. NPDC051513 TaxID=3363908 RepID=UPI0037A21590
MINSLLLSRRTFAVEPADVAAWALWLSTVLVLWLGLEVFMLGGEVACLVVPVAERLES